MEVSVEGRASYKLRLVVTQVLWTIKELGLETSKCDLRVMAQPGMSESEFLSYGMAGRHGNMVMIAVDTKLPIPKIFSTVAHEMIHVKQLARGRLQYKMIGKKEQIFWAGKKMPANMFYYDRPWEIEAFSKQEILAGRFNAGLTALIEQEAKNGKRKRKI